MRYREGKELFLINIHESPQYVLDIWEFLKIYPAPKVFVWKFLPTALLFKKNYSSSSYKKNIRLILKIQTDGIPSN